MILRLLRMRRNVNRNVFNDRKNVSATTILVCLSPTGTGLLGLRRAGDRGLLLERLQPLHVAQRGAATSRQQGVRQQHAWRVCRAGRLGAQEVPDVAIPGRARRMPGRQGSFSAVSVSVAGVGDASGGND